MQSTVYLKQSVTQIGIAILEHYVPRAAIHQAWVREERRRSLENHHFQSNYSSFCQDTSLLFAVMLGGGSE